MAHRREVGKGAIATSLLVFVLWLSFGDALRLRSPTQKQIADESVVITLDGPVKGVLHDTHRSFQVPFPPMLRATTIMLTLLLLVSHPRRIFLGDSLRATSNRAASLGPSPARQPLETEHP